jgi:hypothetical protein
LWTSTYGNKPPDEPLYSVLLFSSALLLGRNSLFPGRLFSGNFLLACYLISSRLFFP